MAGWRKKLKTAIDSAVRTSSTFDDFLLAMELEGYEIKQNNVVMDMLFVNVCCNYKLMFSASDFFCKFPAKFQRFLRRNIIFGRKRLYQMKSPKELFQK